MKTSQQIWLITVCPRLVSILSLGIAFITKISFCSYFEFAMSFRTAAAAGKILIAPKYNSQMKIDEINDFICESWFLIHQDVYLDLFVCS